MAPPPPIGLDLASPPSGPAFGDPADPVAAGDDAFVSATGTANLAALVAAAGNDHSQGAGSPSPLPSVPAPSVPSPIVPESAVPESAVPETPAGEALAVAPTPPVAEPPVESTVEPPAAVPAEVPLPAGTPAEGIAAAQAPPTAVPNGRTVRRAARAHAAAPPQTEDGGTPADTEAEAAAADTPPTGRRAARRAEARAAEAEVSEPAEAYEPAVRDAVHRVIRERRDIRNGFRSDPIPHDVLLRVLEAAHTAPSVGHSQPWDFVVIRSEKTREKMHELATAQREAYAKSLPKGRARQFRELKIEAILDTPVNIVVTADPTRGGRHTLGRHTQPQMVPYSSALAVENLWLAARAEGLGVGWVSFFDERQMVAELGLPEHLEVVAYLCVGYVDEFPEEPELMQAGWSQRRPLSWVVHDEEYGNRALPGEEPHDLLEETLRGIRPLDAKALGEAWERQKRMTKPAGALGMLEIISAQLSGLSRQCPPPIPEPAAVAIFAGDHGVHAQGVTAWPQEVTAQMVANFLGGGAVCNAFANQVGAEICVIDVGVASELPSTPRAVAAQGTGRNRRLHHGPRDDPRGGAARHRRRHRDRPRSGGRRQQGAAHRRDGHRQHHDVGRPDRRLHRRRPGGGHRPRHRHQRRDARPQGGGRPPRARPAPARPGRPDRRPHRDRRPRTRRDGRPAARRGGPPHAGDPRRRQRGCGGTRRPRDRPRGAGGLHRRPPQRRTGPRGRPHHPRPAPLVDLDLRLGEGTGALLALPWSKAPPA